MLVICSGPDSLSAAKKAADMVAAFRLKYDPSGFSVEVLNEPAMTDVLNRIAAPSFFASKRMIRADGLMDASKIADVRALAKRLMTDGGQTVVLTLEVEPIAQKILDEFAKGDVIQYDHPLPKGAAFGAWCLKRATALGVSADIAKRIAVLADGDMWLAEQELQKASANPNIFINTKDESLSVYDRAERYLRLHPSWKELREPVDEEVLAIFMSQARSAVRVRDGATDGLHPFVVKKLGGLRQPHLTNILRGTLRAHAAIRSGLADISESETLL